MKLVTALEFATVLPDDQLEDEHEIIRPGGLGVAEAIAGLLVSVGMVTSAPELDFEHGWEFSVRTGRREYWLMVTDLDETKIVSVRDRSDIMLRLFGDKTCYAEFLQQLHRLLSDDQRFSSVEWCAG